MFGFGTIKIKKINHGHNDGYRDAPNNLAMAMRLSVQLLSFL